MRGDCGKCRNAVITEQVINSDGYEQTTIFCRKERCEFEPKEDWRDIPSNELTLEQARQGVHDLREMFFSKPENDPGSLVEQEPKHLIATIKLNKSDIEKLIDEKLQEIIVSERKMAFWTRVDKTKLRCSNCKVTHLIAQYPAGNIDYCPNCGRRMHMKKR